ncbi:MAG: hemin ABC transporter permease [Candidatus Poribacteria bacterium]|nr:MAG: hemin ABC transporter permease [Candidatus Poribacteria bacterium]
MKARPLLESIPFGWILLGLGLGSGIALVLAAAIGAVPLSPRRQLELLWGLLRGLPLWEQPEAQLYLSLRLPRVLTAYLVGMSLACVGTLFQSLLRNPLAEPFILGVSPGASLGVTVALALGAGVPFQALGWGVLGSRTAAAFLGGLSAVLVAYLLASRGRHLNLTDVLLAGIAVGALATAITSYLWIRVLQEFRGLLYWLMGSFAGSSWRYVSLLAATTLPVILAAWRLASAFDLLLLGEEHAAYLGLDVERLKRATIAVGTLAAAATVAVSGVIGFVGIIVPHLARRTVGPVHTRLIPSASLLGGIFLVACDLIARTVAAPLELPVGMLTALVGAPFFLYVLRQSRAV